MAASSFRATEHPSPRANGQVSERRVRVDGLSFAYRAGSPVLDAISFEARSGDVIGLLGRNGSGKTTVLRLLAGLLRPTAGAIEIAEAPAVVSDRTPFLEPLSARENLLVTLALRGMDTDEARFTAEFFLRCFRLADDADRPVEEFSLGMRRRLALAEGFASNQDLILLDEPTLGLDPAGRDRLAGMLDDHSADGLTVVLATNDASFAELSCDRVLLLHEGRIVAQGTPAIMIAALEAPTLLEIATAGPPPPTAPPDGLKLVTRSPLGLTLAAQHASRHLPEVWAWLEAEACPVREIRVREPGLADVFRAHTGEELPAVGEAD
jgi:oleandomycin transport system ATP-binding protein